MLFSEPKIPQAAKRYGYCGKCKFQCSSASRKFLNRPATRGLCICAPFQCSSASRKFLNLCTDVQTDVTRLFQCSSASRKFLNRSGSKYAGRCAHVSVLFSEPKIPQFLLISGAFGGCGSFSALQRAENSSIIPRRTVTLDELCFSALQRAENSSMPLRRQMNRCHPEFQCSSASRKFLNRPRVERLRG